MTNESVSDLAQALLYLATREIIFERNENYEKRKPDLF